VLQLGKVHRLLLAELVRLAPLKRSAPLAAADAAGSW